MVFFRTISWCLFLFFFTPAFGEEDLYTKKIVANIDLASQRMHVTVEGMQTYEWKISSGRSGFITPAGTFSPKLLHRMHYSRQYDNAPMPHTVFFHRGYAVHGTDYVRRLGKPASHGCVRLSRKNAKIFFNLVKSNGKAQTDIILTGKAPGVTKYVRKKSKKRKKTHATTKRRNTAKRRKIARLKRKIVKLKRQKSFHRRTRGHKDEHRQGIRSVFNF
jgi:hypothetical protein